MYDRRRLLLAFVLAPLTLPLMWTVMFLLWDVSLGEIQMGVALVFMPAAYVAAAVFGVPILLLYRALAWQNVFVYILGGVVMGFATGIGLGFLYRDMDSTILALCSTAGASSGLICWLILHGFNAGRRAAF